MSHNNTLVAHHFDDITQQNETVTLGMWTFLVTEIMFFGVLFMGYTLYRAQNPAAGQVPHGPTVRVDPPHATRRPEQQQRCQQCRAERHPLDDLAFAGFQFQHIPQVELRRRQVNRQQAAGQTGAGNGDGVGVANFHLANTSCKV